MPPLERDCRACPDKPCKRMLALARKSWANDNDACPYDASVSNYPCCPKFPTLAPGEKYPVCRTSCPLWRFDHQAGHWQVGGCTARLGDVLVASDCGGSACTLPADVRAMVPLDRPGN